MKASPTARPDNVLLLQPWSTATSQTMKKRIATAPMIFINMGESSDQPEHYMPSSR
jgi:hypothetical protein